MPLFTPPSITKTTHLIIQILFVDRIHNKMNCVFKKLIELLIYVETILKENYMGNSN